MRSLIAWIAFVAASAGAAGYNPRRRLLEYRPRRGVYITLLVLLKVSFAHKEPSRANISRGEWICASMSIH